MSCLLVRLCLGFDWIHSDYNFVRNGNECVPVGPEPIPAGVCNGDPNQLYKGSSGYRKIPGNTCKDGVKKDELVSKKCSQGTVICLLFPLKLDC